MKKNKVARWPDYKVVDLGETVTFGTSLFLRNDGRALRVLFPAGQAITFCPEEEIEKENKKKI